MVSPSLKESELNPPSAGIECGSQEDTVSVRGTANDVCWSIEFLRQFFGAALPGAEGKQRKVKGRNSELAVKWQQGGRN